MVLIWREKENQTKILNLQMDLSEVYLNDAVKTLIWSPQGDYMVNVAKNKILVREPKNMKVVQIFSPVAEVEYLEWSSGNQ